jgi:inner membrane protein
VDTFTHTLSALVVFSIPVSGTLLPFAVLGAIIPDIDVVYHLVSRRNPRLYLFTHGGFTHSIAGSLLISSLAFGVAAGLANLGLLPGANPALFGPGSLAFMLGGTLLHVLEDFLAYPGIPLLLPVTERKYTAGIFPGPSLVLFGVSLVFFTWAAMGVVGPTALGVYAAIFFGFIGASAAMKGYMALRHGGRTLPTFNPLRWLLIDETDHVYRIREYHLLRGVTASREVDRYRGVSPDEAARYGSLPEVRRHRYFSYLSVADRDGDRITFRDPLREDGTRPYPPYAIRVSVEMVPGAAERAGSASAASVG